MTLSTEFKVGIFTAVGIATLGGTGLMLEGKSFFQKKNHFIAKLENAAGVSERTQVRVSGVQVGYVTQVIVKPAGAEVHFEVRSSIPIPDDSFMQIKSRGMLGDVFIEIERGESHTFLASGSNIPSHGDPSDMQKLIANMNNIATDVKKITASLTDALTGEGDGNLKNLIANLGKTASRIASIVENNDTRINNIIDSIDVFTAQLKKLSTDDNRKKVSDIIANLDASSKDLKDILAKIDKGEGTIGQLVSKDDTAKEIKKTLHDIQNTVSPFSGLHVGLEDRFEYRYLNAEQGSRVENQFNVLFSTTPDRYYLVGLVNSQYGRKVTETQTTTTANGVETKAKDTTENTWLWKFNLQVSQRLGFMHANFLGVRLGFFRSTPGFAVDIYSPHDMFVASAEFYDFDGFPMATDMRYGKRHAMNVKLYGNLFLSPHFYLTAGAVNIVLLDKPWPFFGAGVFFTDRDIRGLFINRDDDKKHEKKTEKEKDKDK